MVDQYVTEIFEICDQSTIPIDLVKCRKILENASNLVCYIEKLSSNCILSFIILF